jgi:hypothetical protein
LQFSNWCVLPLECSVVPSQLTTKVLVRAVPSRSLCGLQNQHLSTSHCPKQTPAINFPNIPLSKPNPHHQTMPFAFPFIPRPLPFTLRRYLVLLRCLSFGSILTNGAAALYLYNWVTNYDDLRKPRQLHSGRSGIRSRSITFTGNARR